MKMWLSYRFLLTLTVMVICVNTLEMPRKRAATVEENKEIGTQSRWRRGKKEIDETDATKDSIKGRAAVARRGCIFFECGRTEVTKGEPCYCRQYLCHCLIPGWVPLMEVPGDPATMVEPAGLYDSCDLSTRCLQTPACPMTCAPPRKYKKCVCYAPQACVCFLDEARDDTPNEIGTGARKDIRFRTNEYWTGDTSMVTNTRVTERHGITDTQTETQEVEFVQAPNGSLVAMANGKLLPESMHAALFEALNQG